MKHQRFAALALAVCALVFASPSAAVPYDQQTSIDILYYARISQCNEEKIQPWTCTPCARYPYATDVQVFNNNTHNVQAVTFYDPENKYIVASFRGTHGLLNWLYNFDAIQVPYPQCETCRVHQGFYTDYLQLRAQVLRAIQTMTEKYPDYRRIITTGHSLGAALSTLAAIDVKLRYPTKLDIFYNYGSPRVGNQAFAQYFDQLIPTANRVTHYHDPVPHLPQKFIGFWHVAREIFYSDQNSTHYMICNDSGEDPACADSVPWYEYNPDDHMYYMRVFCDC